MMGAFVQGVSGFGFGLVVMPILAPLLGVKVAVPLVALLSVVVQINILIRFRSSFSFKAVVPLMIACIIGIPIGVFLLRRLDEAVLLTGLGLLVLSYAVYALAKLRTPQLKHGAWGCLAGLLGGMLSGAYNVGGPPVVIYGQCRGWKASAFKSNLQGYFLAGGITVIIAHWTVGNMTPAVLRELPLAFFGMVAGLVLAFSIDRKLKPATFNTIILWLLVIMGVKLLFFC
jgi:uncharacterized membrane protein YfcA